MSFLLFYYTRKWPDTKEILTAYIRNVSNYVKSFIGNFWNTTIFYYLCSVKKKKMRTKSVIITLLLLASTLSAHAQRTAVGMNQISATFTTSLSSIGGEVLYGRYLTHGYWFGNMTFVDRAERDSQLLETIHHQRYQAGGGYMARLYGTKSRNFNVYGGGDVFIGAEMLDVFKSMTPATRQSFYSAGFSDYRFVFGLSPRAEVEFFPINNLAVIGLVRAPVCLNTKFGILGLELGVGIRVNF